ncbi:striatin-interacting protein 1 homolog isoform X3 [Daphnia pulex]|uniref:striatin-interacting protein 1 homolog isoform X3 n=1 Tax=Daphnia pulex TaxID=6669 RepID=UPI001EDF6152|nr:striatin-interacting protein 1 homolog isoform X3 [Daphnia pulex]
MDEAGGARRGPPKLREILRRQRQDSEGTIDCPDLDFVYDDADKHPNETAELYSYTEGPEFQSNIRAFEELMELFHIRPHWQTLNDSTRVSVLLKLAEQLELSNKALRIKAARAILYIAQGCWGEVQSDAEQQHWTRSNVLLLYKTGIFHTFLELLNYEIENSGAANTAIRKLAVSLADSWDLRVILSVFYTIVEVFRSSQEEDSDEFKKIQEEFRAEIAQPINDELLAVKLLSMVTKFCSGSCPHFPMKKVLLLLWKVLLVSLGGMKEQRELKGKYRTEAGLALPIEDTIEVTRTMRAASPPASAADLLEAQNQKPGPAARPFRRTLVKQSSLDESLTMELDNNDQADDELREIEERRAMEESGEIPQPPSPRPTTPAPRKALPWTPKVRQKDIDQFLDTTRMKFVGFMLPNDRVSLAGLPLPIHEGVRVLKQHTYFSLTEIQIQREEDINKNPVSKGQEDIALTPAEILYQAMLPSLPQYMIALLKILLAAAPTSKAKTDSINIMADVLPEEMPMTVLQSMKLGIDVNRHKEILVKAVAAILLLLLKHLKMNHVYQFEFMSQHLVFANCIPLVLKFFNQNIMAYIGAKNNIAILDFPSCVIGDQPELTAESLEIGTNLPYCWRNLFSCVNLLRILNKLTKWKHSRIMVRYRCRRVDLILSFIYILQVMMLVVFKSAPILKRTLKVKHALLQLYVLKLLKMQTKYLGRQWRKSNMKTMSAIYQKVRHRLNDDWAFGNDLDARPWDFQAEECALRSAVDRFNSRRYDKNSSGCAVMDPEYEPIDNWLTSVLSHPVELTDEFKRHYEIWLQQEVFQASIDWDQLVASHLI